MDRDYSWGKFQKTVFFKKHHKINHCLGYFERKTFWFLEWPRTHILIFKYQTCSGIFKPQYDAWIRSVSRTREPLGNFVLYTNTIRKLLVKLLQKYFPIYFARTHFRRNRHLQQFNRYDLDPMKDCFKFVRLIFGFLLNARMSALCLQKHQSFLSENW